LSNLLFIMEKQEKVLSDPRQGSRSRGFIWLIVIVAVGLFGLWSFDILPVGNTSANLLSSSSSGYQAVFLSNNQVYFGKLSEINSVYPKLTDIFYLRVTQRLQPSDLDNLPQQDINLVKLGSELHGPEDVMRISRDQILFFEDLRADSQIVTAIKDYQAQNAN